MKLDSARIVEQDPSPHAHERAALDFAVEQLPNADPYHVWQLCELVDPPTGRLYEIDLIVLGYSALYLVEVKSGPGRYVGDSVDWHRLPPDGSKPRYMEPPLRLANHKAKVLKTRLERKMQGRAPWVEALVFLSAPEDELQIDLREDGRLRVVTRSTLRDALTRHEFFGADAFRKPTRIAAPEMRDVVQAMSAIGLRRRKGQAFAGQYALGDVLLEGSGFQDRSAQHRTLENLRRRARVYLVPQQTSVERRQQLGRAADREAQLLYGLREHPHILKFIELETDAPMGPTVLFDEFEGGIPLPAFLRQEPTPSFDERVAIVGQVGRALHFCHRKGVIHRALSPDAVLVRRHPETGAMDTRLFNFQLAEGERASATVHWSQLASDPWAIYQAPELRDDPACASVVTDIFSLGAVAYFALTGKEPGASALEVDARLLRDGALDPAAAIDNLPASVADLVREATKRTPALRFDDLLAWVETLFVEAAPAPAVGAVEVGPLDAKEGEILDGDLLIEKLLGHGATSRVLQVTRNKDGGTYALKVSLSEAQDERLRDEADALATLRHPRIAQLVERRVIGGRQCLLLSLAGDETLQAFLAREGSASLDYAARFGEDLLGALEVLEEQGVTHRDIKPANLGVGAPSKKGTHLTLFDFSLVRAAASELRVGTSAYRDPFLARRGQWDAAADRFSAAITLHEMLTGVRPTRMGDATAPDGDAEVIVSAERFDASCREALLAFFTRALAREVDHRFESAAQMRRAWERAFHAGSERPHAPAAASEEPRSVPRAAPSAAFVEPPSAEALAAIAPSVPVSQLPLSTRAKNALDRAGVSAARDLLALPDNRLSVVRGVGRLVLREITDFRAAWAKVVALEAPPAEEPFFASYRGDDLITAAVGIDAIAATVLADAGLRTLRGVASAPAATVVQLAARHGFDAGRVHAVLDDENAKAAKREHPSTVEAWVDALLAPSRKRTRYLLSLYGLAAPFLGRLDATAAEVAAHHGVTPANVYQAVAEARAGWEKHPSFAELRALVRNAVDDAGGALALPKVGGEVLARVAYDRAAAPEASLAHGAALARIVAEVEKEALGGLVFVRLHDQPWIVLGEAQAAGLHALGSAADALADRDVLASSGEASRILGEAAADTPFAALTPDALARLGADVSRRAACSTRGEIYPRGMAATRALELCAPLLRGRLTPDAVAARVAARYPDAEPLPARPALDALLEPFALTFDGEVYHRPGERAAATSLQTSFSSLPRETDEHAADFDDRLKNAVGRGGLRVVGVRAVRAEAATLALARRLVVDPVDLGAELAKEMAKLQAEADVDPAAVHQADRDGEASPETWALLRALARDAAERLADRLLAAPASGALPLVLAQPGLLARYRLDGFSARLRAAAEATGAAPIFVVFPSRDVGRVPRLDGWSIAGATTMWMPESWVSATAHSADPPRDGAPH